MEAEGGKGCGMGRRKAKGGAERNAVRRGTGKKREGEEK